MAFQSTLELNIRDHLLQKTGTATLSRVTGCGSSRFPGHQQCTASILCHAAQLVISTRAVTRITLKPFSLRPNCGLMCKGRQGEHGQNMFRTLSVIRTMMTRAGMHVRRYAAARNDVKQEICAVRHQRHKAQPHRS